MTAKELAISTKNVLQENSPSILAALGVGGVVTTALAAYNFGYHYGRDEEQRITEGERPLTGKEKFEAYWRPIVPTLLVAGTTITCIVASTAISTRLAFMMSYVFTSAAVTTRAPWMLRMPSSTLSFLAASTRRVWEPSTPSAMTPSACCNWRTERPGP